MTNSDLHQNFRVEYDKANVISSYPSFLSEEIDIWLNKGYKTLVTRMFAGNNVRQIGFEGDTKNISDLQSLIKQTTITSFNGAGGVNNCVTFNTSSLPSFLYFITGILQLGDGTVLECKLATHDAAKKASETAINKPWLPNPVIVLHDNKINVFYDTVMTPKQGSVHNIQGIIVTYCAEPTEITYTVPNATVEVSDTLCSEIVSLAVYYALENIESQRSQTKSSDIKLME